MAAQTIKDVFLGYTPKISRLIIEGGVGEVYAIENSREIAASVDVVDEIYEQTFHAGNVGFMDNLKIKMVFKNAKEFDEYAKKSLGRTIAV